MALMPQTPFQWFVPATDGNGLIPASFYYAVFYAAGTTTPKTIYTDPELTVPYPSPSNTAVLDAEGRALIYLGAGGYKLVITNVHDEPIYEQDNISGEGAFGTGFAASYADLADVNSTLNTYTYIAGYYTPGDGGEGMFYNTVSSDAADGGYVQVCNDNVAKRWFRIPDENGDVRAASFGFCGSGTKTNNLLAADAYAASINARLRVQFNPSTRIEAATLSSKTLVFNQDAGLLMAAGSHALEINSVVEAGGWDLFSTFASGDVTLTAESQETSPEWFGASISASGGDNATAFAKWKAAGGGVFVVPPGTWAHTGTFTPVAGKTTLFYGVVGSRAKGPFYGTDSQVDVNGGYVPSTGAGTTIGGSIDANGTIHAEGGITSDLTISAPTIGAGAGGITSDGDIETQGDFNAPAGSITVDGDVTAGGGVFAQGGPVSATQSVTAGTTMSASNEIVSGAYVQAKAGTSPADFKASGRLYANTATHSTSGTGATDLSGYQLLANSLANDGDSIRITGSGNAAVGGARTISLKLSGGATILTSAFAGPSGTCGWKVIADITRTTSTTATISWIAALEDQSLVSPTSFSTVSITFSSDNTFQFVGTAAGSGAIVQNMMLVDIFPT